MSNRMYPKTFQGMGYFFYNFHHISFLISMKRQKLTDPEEEERNRQALNATVRVMMSRRLLEGLMDRQPELRLVLKNECVCNDPDCAPAVQESAYYSNMLDHPTRVFPSYKDVPLMHAACCDEGRHEDGPPPALMGPKLGFHPEARVPLLLVDRRCIKPAPGVAWYAHGWQHAAPGCRRIDMRVVCSVAYALTCRPAGLAFDLCQCILRRLFVRSLRRRLTNSVTVYILSFLQE